MYGAIYYIHISIVDQLWLIYTTWVVNFECLKLIYHCNIYYYFYMLKVTLLNLHLIRESNKPAQAINELS